MEKNKLIYYLGFSYCFGIGPMTFKVLKQSFSNIKKAYLASGEELKQVRGFRLTERFLEFRRKFDPVKELERLEKNKITVLAVDDEDYPESLKNISDPPICLYVKSSAPKFLSPLIDKAQNRVSHPPHPKGTQAIGSKRVSELSAVAPIFFAIVGTRKPTPYGIQVARKFAYELSEAGFVIVSGMAMGIDTVAHQAALDAGGKTIAVLGCGVNIIYPAVNYRLYENIIETGGAVISEFPPDQTVLKGLFISRNRIISGLSRGVLIAEGLKDSGALITARFAGEQGKEVFAPPNPITSDMSQAPNFLLKQGAKLVTSIEDIMEEFDMKITPRKKEDIRKKLNETEKLIFDILQKNPQTVDDLAIELRKTVSEILNTISVLEIEGIVEKNLEHKYQIKLN